MYDLLHKVTKWKSLLDVCALHNLVLEDDDFETLHRLSFEATTLMEKAQRPVLDRSAYKAEVDAYHERAMRTLVPLWLKSKENCQMLQGRIQDIIKTSDIDLPVALMGVGFNDLEQVTNMFEEEDTLRNQMIHLEAHSLFLDIREAGYSES